MISDSVYVINQAKMPNVINATISNIPDSVAVKGTVSVNNFPNLIQYDSQLDSLVVLSNSISEYGIGFSDVVTHITFPLIIAVFAFALPFLFSAINRVNDKYDSQTFARMFSTSKRYKSLWISIATSMICILVCGFLSLFRVRAIHHLVDVYIPIASVILSIWMVVSVFLFLQCCLLYNKPYALIDEIEKRYKADKEKAKRRDSKQTSRFKSKTQKSKSVARKSFWKRILSMFSNVNLASADSNYVNCLSELCRYALSNNDYNLYSSIWSKIYDLQNSEKIADDTTSKTIVDDGHYRLTTSFLVQSFKHLCNENPDTQIRHSLIRTWLQNKADDKFPNSANFYLMMKALFEAASKGNLNVVSQYFSDCKYSYNYILNLPQVLYVKGGDLDYLKATEERCNQEWNRVIDYHFILAAFAHYMGLKSLFKQVISEEFGVYVLPRTRQGLLYSYVRCKDKMNPDGGYDHYSAEELFGKRIDPEFLDQFAVLLFALLNDGDANNFFWCSSDPRLEKLADYKSVFYNVGEKLKKDASIKSAYSKICQLNIKKAFDESRRILVSRPSVNSYEDPLPQLMLDNIRIHINNQVAQLKNFTGYGIWGSNTEEQVSSMSLGVFKTRLLKHLVRNWQTQDYYYDLKYITDTIANRALYLYLKAISKMQSVPIRVKPDLIVDQVKEAVDGHPEDYILLDFDSDAIVWLPVKYDRSNLNKSTCEGIDYVSINCISYLKDSFPYQQLKGKLFLIRKVNLPILDRAQDDVQVDFQDNGSYANNSMDLRLMIDTHYIIRYKENIKIKSFEVERMSL